MEEIIKTFSIDWKLLLAQVINFLIVFVVLWFGAVKPLIKLMKERTEKIEKGLKDAEEMSRIKEETEASKKEALLKAEKEAQRILKAANIQAEKNRALMLTQAKKDVEGIVGKAHREITDAKDKMIKDVKKEVADMVISATEKVLKEKIDGKKQKELVNEALDNIK